MKIEINLPNPKSCKECPMIGVSNWGYELEKCNKGYWNDEKVDRTYCSRKYPRPQKCIDELGE